MDPPHTERLNPISWTSYHLALVMEMCSALPKDGVLVLPWLGEQCPLSLLAITEEALTLLPNISHPQTHFRITPGCTHISQPEMLQGMMVPAPGLCHRKPHGVSAYFQAQAVLPYTGLSSQKVQELIPSSSFYSVR